MHATRREPTREPDGTDWGFQAGVPRKLVTWGLLVWFSVAVTIRLTGHILLNPNNPLVVAGFFALVIPLMALVTYPIYHRFDIERAARPVAAGIMSIPGMFLDVGLVVNANQIFPAMSPAMVVNFGAILLFGYAVVLLTGFYPAWNT
ncbi:MAG: DUF5367 family protein [Halobacteriales archaeon]|nr:DUF5367 family protein [Halobacteriales archaeon]